MIKQESGRLNQADLKGGSKTIGFVEYGLPYSDVIFDICLVASITRLGQFTIGIKKMLVQHVFKANDLKCSIIKPFKIIKHEATQFASLSCTIRNTCGGKVQRFQKGETIVLNAVIRDPDGTLFNPSSGVKAEIRNSSGTIVMAETSMTQESDGEYTLDVQTTAVLFTTGEYIVIFKATDGDRIAIDWDRLRLEVVPS